MGERGCSWKGRKDTRDLSAGQRAEQESRANGEVLSKIVAVREVVRESVSQVVPLRDIDRSSGQVSTM